MYYHQITEETFEALAIKHFVAKRLKRIKKIVDCAFGPDCGAAVVKLEGGISSDDTRLDKSDWLALDHFIVLDAKGEEIAPNLELSWWVYMPDRPSLTAVAGMQLYNDETDPLEYPAKGSQQYRIMAHLAELLHHHLGKLPFGHEEEIKLIGPEAETVLAWETPKLYRAFFTGEPGVQVLPSQRQEGE